VFDSSRILIEGEPQGLNLLATRGPEPILRATGRARIAVLPIEGSGLDDVPRIRELRVDLRTEEDNPAAVVAGEKQKFSLPFAAWAAWIIEPEDRRTDLDHFGRLDRNASVTNRHRTGSIWDQTRRSRPARASEAAKSLGKSTDCGSSTGDDYVLWASDALTQGHDTPTLRRLAGLDTPANWFQAHEMFEQVVGELGVPLPTSDEARRAYLAAVALAIVEGRTSPEEGLEVIHRAVVSPLQHPADLQPWCDLCDEWVSAKCELLVGQERDDEVLRLARESLRLATSSSVPCPCCRSATLTSRAAFDICRLCGWEDDVAANRQYVSLHLSGASAERRNERNAAE
jgi:hypothetical protein